MMILLSISTEEAEKKVESTCISQKDRRDT